MDSTLQRPRPILMTPIRRCGSHALRLRLNQSPEFYSPYPLHIIDFMPLLDMYGDLSDDFNYFQLVVDVVGLQTATMVKWENVALDPVRIFEAIAHQPRSIHRIAWEMLFHAGQQHRAKVVMDKSLDNILYAHDLIELFDDVLFLNVVRDPRAQVASINRAIIHDFDTVLNTMHWVKAHDMAHQLSIQHPDRVLTIRFEDFISHPAPTLNAVCDFMGIEFLDDMLDVSSSSEAQQLARMSALWQTNHSAPIPANIDKFRKSLSMEEIEAIETLAADHMERYGYERITSGQMDVNDELLSKAKHQSKERKTQAWDELRDNDPRDFQLRSFRADYLAMIRGRLHQSVASTVSDDSRLSVPSNV